ncbi:MAG: short-chain dehydrogenase/reductase [Microbacteriaceae bacterium]|jgi:NAD(P)-dependent dehydrogenase (short-subunit alcohol dehydrogenase family)|nr:short-chain dehydrogenase/reductase [Microbacteriaceae bacterium]
MSQPAQQQDAPGTEAAMDPAPDYGETSYRGSGRLTDKVAVITGADSGIGKAVALAFAREGADVVISYLNEHDDAERTRAMVTDAGRRALVLAGDLSNPQECRALIDQAVKEFGHIDVLVHNAAFQRVHESLTEIPDEEWDHTLAVNLSAYFHLAKAAVPHMKAGSSIIATSSIQADSPSPELMPYAATKAAISNMTGSLAQMLAEQGIRANTVAPGPIWTPLIPATMPEEKVESFGEQVPFARAGQPSELAPVYVMLASDEASYVSGAVIAVTGGKPML